MKKILLLLLCTWLFPLLSNAQCTIAGAPDVTICSTQQSFPLSATATGYTAYAWTTSGTGTFSIPTNIGTVYAPSAADITAGTVTLSITASGGCSSKTAVTLITIVPTPTINAGADKTSCGNTSLNATPTNATTINWTTSGSGTFSPNAQTTDATYMPSAADQSSGSVTLSATATGNSGCVSSADQMIITFIPPNIVDAGMDLTTCQTTPVTISSSSVLNATTITWSTSGTGTFINSNTIHPTYHPSSADSIAGNVTLTVTGSGSGSCPTVSANLKLNIITGASVNAGAPQSTCGNNVTLNATFSGAGGVTWTTAGSGTFSNNTVANPTYTPSQADRTAGVVLLTATTTGNGSCPAVSSTTVVNINARVRLIIGRDSTYCPNTIVFPTVYVDASTVTWTTSGTGTFSNASSLTPVYTPSAADNTAGQVNLTATSAPNGSCPSETGTMKITFAPTVAVANAGPDVTICGNTITLNGSVTNATGGVWSASGTSTFNPGANYLNTTYTFSNADITAGSVTFTLTTTGTCGAAVSDQMTVMATAASAPTVNAGPDQNITGTSVTLNGTVTGATGAAWSTRGSGVFGSSTALNTTYTPSTLDITNGLVVLALTSTGNGSCPSVTDSLLLTIGNTFAITGTINAGTNVLDKGIVFVFKKEGTTLQFVKTVSVTSSDAGTYSFGNIPAGTYIIFASPIDNSNYLSNFLPTYSGGVQDWNSAQPIVVTGNATYNLSLSTYASAKNTGSDIIAGVVYLTASGQATARTTASGSNTPAAHTTVFLADANGNKIAYTQTDANGRYQFTDVQAGKYTLTPEFGGTSLSGNSPSIPIVADGNPATVEDGTMTLEQRTGVVAGIMNAKSLNLIAYPNPTKGSVSINLISSAGTGIIKLLNETGTVQLLQQVDLTTSTFTLNIETLPAGMYILQLTAADEVYTSKVIKY